MIRHLRNLYLRWLEHHYLISAEVEEQMANDKVQNARWYRTQALLIRMKRT